MGELPLRSDAFKKRMTGDRGAREAAKVEALGLNMDAHGALAARFRTDFSADAAGFDQFADISDEMTRAVASGRVQTACESAGRNLIELRLHEHGVYEAIGPHGLPWIGRESDMVEELGFDFLGLHLVGAFRAVASVIDCWAAVLAGVVRLPVRLSRASAHDILKIAPKLAEHQKAHPSAPSEQVELWEKLGADFQAAAEAAGPVGWLDWSVLMRNALVHRGRGLTMLQGRPTAAMIIPRDYDVYELVRYDPILLRRPWVQQIQDAAEQGGPLGQWLGEPAQETITELRRTVNAFSEAIAVWALEAWAGPVQARLVSPEPRWVESWDEPGFAGFTGQRLTATEARTNSADLDTLELAHRLGARRDES